MFLHQQDVPATAPAPADDIPAPAPAPAPKTVEDLTSQQKTFGKPASTYSDFLHTRHYLNLD